MKSYKIIFGYGEKIEWAVYCRLRTKGLNFSEKLVSQRLSNIFEFIGIFNASIF